jgi:hypothetical protein
LYANLAISLAASTLAFTFGSQYSTTPGECQATAVVTHFGVVVSITLLAMDAVDNSFILASHKDPVQRTTTLLVLAAYSFGIFVVGVSWLVGNELIGSKQLNAFASVNDDAGGGALLAGSGGVYDAVEGHIGYCWISGGVATWGLVAPMLFGVAIAVYSVVRRCSAVQLGVPLLLLLSGTSVLTF